MGGNNVIFKTISESTHNKDDNFSGGDLVKNLVETAIAIRDTEPGQSEEVLTKALNLARNIPDDRSIAICLSELAVHLISRNDIKGGLAFYDEAACIFEQIEKLEDAVSCYRKLSEIQSGISNFKDALDTELKALRLIKIYNDPLQEANGQNRIGEILKNIGDYKKAISHHEMALEITGEVGDKSLMSATCFYIGNCYNWVNELDMAYNYLDRALTIAEDLKDKSLQVKPTGSLAILYTKLREYDKALDYFFRAIELANALGNKLLKADLLQHLGKLHLETRKYEDALSVLDESLNIVNEEEVKAPLGQIYMLLAEVYEKKGDFREALNYYKKFMVISGDVVNEEVALKSKGLQLKYDFEELRKEKDLAERTVRLKDEFIANLSHEIRTPLNGVLGMAGLLGDTKPTPEQLEYINTIKLSANNLIGIINDLLEFSNIQAGRVVFEKKEFNLKDSIVGVLQMYKVKADEKNIRLEHNIQNNLPDTIIGDSTRLNQILLNLVNNSVKFTESGSIKIHVSLVSTEGLDIKLLFEVTDTGVGIPQDKLDSIFESFTQVSDDTSKLYGGTGLGLAIVKQLTELQKGSISVVSASGKGSSFKVELPFRLKEPVKTPSGGRKGAGVPARDLTGVSVLLVEDNKVNQFLAQKLLSKMGFNVELASSGKEALQFLNNGNTCDVILMDVQMPEMTGYELTKNIRSLHNKSISSIPIIALTAYASANEKEKARLAGMDEYLTKPYSPNELLSVIMKVTAKSEAENNSMVNDEVQPQTIRDSTEKLVTLFGGNRSDVLSLLQMLVVQIPQIVDEMGQQIKIGNWAATFQSAHKLKSSLGLLKIKSLSNLITEIEEYSRDKGDPERITPLYNKFQLLANQTVALIKSEIVRLKQN